MIALEANKKYYTTGELKDMGYSYYKIGQMEENGQLHRINRTTYENLSYKDDENDFINAAAYVPDGVICLMSAARYYELTDFLPDVINVAINRKKKVSTLPDWPEIKIFYFDPSRMDTGVKEIKEGGDSFDIILYNIFLRLKLWPVIVFVNSFYCFKFVISHDVDIDCCNIVEMPKYSSEMSVNIFK